MIKGIHTTDPLLVKDLGVTMQRAWDFGMDIKDTYLEAAKGDWNYDGVAEHKVKKFQKIGMEVLGVLVADNEWRAPVWNTETNCGTLYTPETERIQRWWNVNKDLGVGALFYYYARPQNDDKPNNMANKAGLKSWAKYFERLNT